MSCINRKSYISKVNRAILISILCFCATLVHGQNGFLSKTQMQEDLQFLHQNIERYHPGLGRFGDDDFHSVYDSLINSLPDSMDERSFAAYPAHLIAAVHCVHSRIYTPKKDDAYWNHTAIYPPFNIKKRGERYYISESFDTRGVLQANMEIIGINSMPITEYVSLLLPYIPVDGANETRKFKALERGFYGYSVYLPRAGNDLAIKIINQNGKTQNLRLAFVSRETIISFRVSDKKPIEPNYTLRWHGKDSIPELRMASFAIEDEVEAKFQFASGLDSIFTVLQSKNSKSLILDLRGNPGGLSEMGAVLGLYLSEKQFVYAKKLLLKSDSFPSYMTLDVPGPFAVFPLGIQQKNEIYYWPHHPVRASFQPSSNHFKGKLYVLTDGNCTSTCSEVTSIIHENRESTFIGEAPGGSYSGGNSGVLAYFELPNSQVRVRIPLVAYYLRVEKQLPNDQLLPDYKVAEDPLENEDLPLEKALELIRE